MVFVKVRETYDLHTVRNKMTVIGIHTPKTDIIKKNFPGLLMQCKAYRPVSCDVRVACASMLPLDPQGVGLAEGDVAPEDIFNPILYKAMSNFGMSQLEARINAVGNSPDVAGPSANVEVDGVTTFNDEFNVYYGLLSNAHGWKHANPQSGLSMNKLTPLVWEMLYNIGDNRGGVDMVPANTDAMYPGADTVARDIDVRAVRGNAKRMPFINCTSYSKTANGGYALPGFPADDKEVGNASVDVPSLNVYVGCIIVPPSRLHELFYRMVVEWTIEFTAIRPIGEITDWGGLSRLGDVTHLINYDYSATKKAVTGDSDTILDSDSCMVSANVEVDKVM